MTFFSEEVYQLTKQVVEEEENQLSMFKGNLSLVALWEVGDSFEVSGKIT